MVCAGTQWFLQGQQQFLAGTLQILKTFLTFLASTQDINPKDDGYPDPFDTNITHISDTQHDQLVQADITHISDTQQDDKNENNSGL